MSNVPLRVRFDPEQPIGELVRAVQRAQARRQPFEHASLAQIQEWSGRSGSRALFDTLALLNLDTAPAPDWPGGLSFEPVSATLDAGTPVVVALIREESGIVLRTVYDSTNPSGAQMARAVFDAVRDVSLAPAGAPTSEFLSIVPVAGGGAAPPVDQEPSADDRAARIARPEEAGGNSALAVMEIWRQTLGISGAELHQDFFHVGGTSLQAIELFHRLERLFGRPLSVSTLFRAPTLGALLDELEQPLAASGPVVPIRTRGTSPPVFAAPGIHGEVVGLAPVAWALGDDQPFFGLEPKGFDRKTAPLTTIEEMVEYFLPPVIEQAEGRPLHLLGICFGSFVVLELARALQARSIPVRSVSLLEPGVLDASDGSIPGEDAWALYGQPSTLGVARRRLRRFKALFRTADWPGRVAMVAQKGRRALEIVRSGGLGPEFEGELARGQSTVGLVEAGVAAIRAHRPEPIATPCRIFVAAEHLPASGQSDWRLDWVELFEPSPDVVAVPGRGVMDALREEAFARSLGAWLSAMSHP